MSKNVGSQGRLADAAHLMNHSRNGRWGWGPVPPAPCRRTLYRRVVIPILWSRLDDQFTDHPKIVAAGPLAGWLYVCGLCYASRYLTDGFIPLEVLDRLANFASYGVTVQDLADKLVGLYLWDSIATKGYQIHDFLEYHPSKKQVLKRR